MPPESEELVEAVCPPNVALVGLQGVGKTTLAVTIAKRLERPDANGICFVPENSRTEKYVNLAWERLQAREWVDSTEEGQFIDLSWGIYIGARKVSSFRIVDVAGQDIYNIFNDEAFRNSEAISEDRRSVLQYLADAEVVFFLIDLGDFIGECNPRRKIDRAAAIRAALSHVRSRLKKCCLILTQGTKYLAYARERNYVRKTQGGGPEVVDWRALIRDEVPSLYYEHLQDDQLPIKPFSAVEETCIIFDSESHVREVPQPGFRTRGLEQIMSWLKDCIVDRPGPEIPYGQISEQEAFWTTRFFYSIATLDVTVKNLGADGDVRLVGRTMSDGVEIETQTLRVWLARNEEKSVRFYFAKTTNNNAPEFQASARCVI